MDPNIPLPFIRIDLERVRSSVVSMFAAHNEEFQELIKSTLAETLTEDWVKEQIKIATRKVIEEAVTFVGNDLMTKREIRNVVIAHVAEAFSKKHNGE